MSIDFSNSATGEYISPAFSFLNSPIKQNVLEKPSIISEETCFKVDDSDSNRTATGKYESPSLSMKSPIKQKVSFVSKETWFKVDDSNTNRSATGKYVSPALSMKSPIREISDVFDINSSKQLFKFVKVIPPSDSYNTRILTDKLEIQILNQVGKGTYSTVYKVEVFAKEKFEINGVHFSPEKSQLFALKRSHKNQSYSSIQQKIRGISNSKFFDSGILAFCDGVNSSYALHHLYDGDLSQTSFAERKKPIHSILKVLIDIATGLEILHSQNWIHRDIKGLNLLVKNDEGAITDFDTLATPSNIVHTTRGTPKYLDSLMFGNQKMTLISQKNREGLEIFEGDVYAFGVTIIRDVLIKNFFAKIESKEIKNLIDELRVTMIKKNWDTYSLKEIAVEFPNRVNYIHAEKPELQVVVINPKIETYQENLIKASNLLNYNDADKFALQELISLACEMQGSLIDKRPKALQILNRLQTIFSNLESGQFIKRNYLNNSRIFSKISSQNTSLKNNLALGLSVNHFLSAESPPVKLTRHQRNLLNLQQTLLPPAKRKINFDDSQGPQYKKRRVSKK